MNRIGIVHNYYGTDFTASPDEYCSRITRSARIGFDLMTVQQDVPFMFSKEDKQKLLDTGEKENVKINYSGGFGPDSDICSDSAEAREKGAKHIQTLAKLISEMDPGAEFAGAITGVFRDTLGSRDKSQCWDYSVNAMREGMKGAEDCGIVFSLEVLNRFEHFLVNTCEDAIRYVEEVGSPNLKILLDTYHMNIEEDSLVDAIVLAGDKLGLFHIGENNRRPPGNGHIQWDEVVQALKKINYQGDTCMEPVVLPGGTTGQPLAIWRDLTHGEDLDSAAKKGLEFYKQKLETA